MPRCNLDAVASTVSEARFADRLGHFVEHADQSLRAVRGARHVVRYLIGRAVLLLQRRGNCRGIAIDLTHAFWYCGELRQRSRGSSFARPQPACDLFGRLRRLHRKRFHFRSEHGKPASRLACARCFDRRIEGKQVRLTGNVADQADHFADLLNGVGNARHVFVGRFGLGTRVRCDFGGLTGSDDLFF